MQIGIYITILADSTPKILVIYNPDLWATWIKDINMDNSTLLTRPATSPEIEAMSSQTSLHSFWYDSWDALFEDEERSGATHEHLQNLLKVYRSLMRAHNPKSGQIAKSLTIGDMKSEAA